MFRIAILGVTVTTFSLRFMRSNRAPCLQLSVAMHRAMHKAPCPSLACHEGRGLFKSNDVIAMSAAGERNTVAALTAALPCPAQPMGSSSRTMVKHRRPGSDVKPRRTWRKKFNTGDQLLHSQRNDRSLALQSSASLPIVIFKGNDLSTHSLPLACARTAEAEQSVMRHPTPPHPTLTLT